MAGLSEVVRMIEIWHQCVAQLRTQIPEAQFKTWIAPLSFVEFEESSRILTLSIPTRFKLDMVRAQYSPAIAKTFSACSGVEASVNFELPNSAATSAHTPPIPADVNPDPATLNDGHESPPSAASIAASAAASLAAMPAHMQAHAQSQARRADPANEHIEKARLNSSLTFDSFVTGKANQLARAAAQQVSEAPGTSYNPLYIHGGVGLGKTHLLHAVGNALLERNPRAKVRYLHAEQYVRDVVGAYQRKAFDDFKRYYHSLDLLLIDDIQFFEGKNASQEEFFYTFEALISANKQIIITSDTYPQSLAGIEDRLVSRFASGLNVGIEVPDFEMRVAILQNKAAATNSTLPEEVAFFIAKNLRQNVRELEGALRKVLAYSHFNGKPVSMELAKDALKEILVANRGQVTVESIQKTVADYYKIKVADMYSKRRPANIALPRQIAMYFAKDLTQKSLPEIGELFGGRDHTTVLHAVRKITSTRQLDAQLNHDLHVLEQTLKG
jgi:chromosomal replication initiator protein